jgi:DNA polymerase III epsilon subunit-like protein
MVGINSSTNDSAVARVSIVNYHGHVLLDTFVQPKETVADFRTWISGIREEDLVGAPDFESVQKQVSDLVEGRILVGHAIDNDLKVSQCAISSGYGTCETVCRCKKKQLRGRGLNRKSCADARLSSCHIRNQ